MTEPFNPDDLAAAEETESLRSSDRGLLRSDDPVPGSIGPFKILEVLGKGGMGVVYLAEQTTPIRRRVAIKLIKLGMDTKAVLARFEAERQALALMDHPNIAKVFEAGATESGRPYFVMEHVRGIPITAHCDRHRLSTEERLDLFGQVCQAVQHAHQKGVIHRDLKPSNVLVSVNDGQAVPKIIDFGVAKATQQHLTEKTLFTEQGQLIGTPEYMSPEQAEMTAQDVDTRTDIYSLGVLLYELLAGALPFDPKTLRRAGFAEIQRIIREEDPPKPSTRLTSLGVESGAVAKKHHADVATLARQLRGDLDWITMKALEKDRTRRYATAAEFADDILRHLHHEPVRAFPPSATYRLRKFVRRNRPGVAVAACLVVLVAGGAVFAGYVKQRDAAERQRQRVAQAAAQVQAGIIAQNEDDYEKAQEAYQRALLLDPDNFYALANLARLKQERYLATSPNQASKTLLEDSRVLCVRALDQQPDHFELLNLVCVTLYMLGDLAEAEKACRRAVVLGPDDPLPSSNLAMLLALQHRMEDALAAAQQAVATAERIGEADTPWAAGPWQMLATMQLHFAQPPALQCLERAFACYPNDEWAYTLRAKLRLTLPGYVDLAEALSDATTADSITRVADARIKRVLALASLRNDRFADAARHAQEALDLGGQAAVSHLLLALAKAGLNDAPAARQHLEAARAAWPASLDKDGLLVSSERNALWIDTADEMRALLAEAVETVGRLP